MIRNLTPIWLALETVLDLEHRIRIHRRQSFRHNGGRLTILDKIRVPEEKIVFGFSLKRD
jgi:hypothetical protein